MAIKPKRLKPQTNMRFWVENPEPKPRKSYPQMWSEYNLAQTSEKLMFMDMLRDLTLNIVTKKQQFGRPRANVQEMLYCMTMLVYAGKSSRRVISELHISKDRNLITKVPHFNTILKYFNNEELRNYLEMLITMSSVPLRMLKKTILSTLLDSQRLFLDGGLMRNGVQKQRKKARDYGEKLM